MNKPRENIWNVPNVLTLIRMALIPVFVVLYCCNLRFWALGVFLMASFTDWLDGHIARKYHLITNFGKLMDPLADKLMIITALLSQAITGVLPWPAVMIVAAKECIMVVGGIYMYKKGIVVYSELVGKAAQVTFIAALVLSFFHDSFSAWPFHPDLVLLWISVVLTLVALVFYSRSAYRKLIKEPKRS